MVSEKEKTNRKWVSTESYRDNYDRIFQGKTKHKDYRHQPSLIKDGYELYDRLEDVVYHYGKDAVYELLPNGFYKLRPEDNKKKENQNGEIEES